MQVITVANQKGGVGKTTTTISLAALLAEQKKRVLLLDIDPQGSLTHYLRIKPKAQGLANLFIKQKMKFGVQDVQEITQSTRLLNIDLIPASLSLATLEQGAKHQGLGLVVHRIMQLVKDKYDFVIIDCPPVMGLLMINALAACEMSVIPVQTEGLAIYGLTRMVDTLDMVINSKRKKIKHLIVPTMHNVDNYASVATLKKLHLLYEERVWDSFIPYDNKLQEAGNYGIPISSYSETAVSTKYYKDLLATILYRLSLPIERDDVSRRTLNN